MGKDNIHHKRKAKQAKELARRKARRKPYDKVLIVCEGGKTEPNYFEELKDYYELPSANVEITGKCGSSPMSVVTHARTLYREARKAGDAFDKVFCVFDKDVHDGYGRALDILAEIKPEGEFVAIPSVPCFEYWLLLHFIYTDKPFHSTGNKSICETVIHEINRNHWPAYKKAAHGVFNQRLKQLDFAKGNAARALTAAQEDCTDNPSTRVYELVSYLQELKK
ncbi:MAG TPA: RloB domain-containing protein [Gammaproteobacteria bacterium]|nr:RloB domain-containing protein [Gammaproteobacteria bacterium]